MRRIAPITIAIITGAFFTAPHARANEPTLAHVASTDGLAHFTLTNPTQDRLFLLTSCTRTTRVPRAQSPTGEIDFPIRWRVEQADRMEGVMVAIPPSGALHLVCTPPPGKDQWRVTAYVFRRATDKQAAYEPATEVVRTKARHDEKHPRVYPEASNQTLERIAAWRYVESSHD